MTHQEKIKNWIRSKDPVEQINQCKDVLGRIFIPQYRRYNSVHAKDLTKPFHFLIDMKTNRVLLATHNAEIGRAHI
mgnify:FL=1